MDEIPQIIYEEGLDFDDDMQMYDEFLKYCDWFLFDGDASILDDIPDEMCMYYHDMCNLFVEPNLMARQQIADPIK